MGGLLSKKEEDNKGKEKPTAVTRFTCQPYVLRRVRCIYQIEFTLFSYSLGDQFHVF
jgi:hypothetical protein